MARGLNKVMLIGNVGRDPEMRFTASGKPITSFSLAVSRRWRASDGHRREETEWFNIVAWGNLAEICDRFVNKSQQVYVEGRLQTRSWENDQGIRQFRTDVIANEVTVLEPRHRDRHSSEDIEEFEDETTFSDSGFAEKTDAYPAETEEVEPSFEQSV